MARINRSASVTPSQTQGGIGDWIEQGPRADCEIRIRCAGGAELSDAELGQVVAAGGRIDPGGANN